MEEVWMNVYLCLSCTLVDLTGLYDTVKLKDAILVDGGKGVEV